ncbi:hypothetical protein UlMin_028428 [Ulmus minor]
MGASKSTLSSSQRPSDEITTVSEQLELADPILKKLKSLKIMSTVDPKVLLEPFSMYRDYQEEKTQKISTNQNKIEVADALAIKLLQCLNYLVSTMKASSRNLSEVEIGELKGRLTEVISNCDALCRRIVAEGPQSLRSSVKPFAVTITAATMLYPPLHNSSKAGTGGAGPTILAISYSSFWS